MFCIVSDDIGRTFLGLGVLIVSEFGRFFGFGREDIESVVDVNSAGLETKGSVGARVNCAVGEMSFFFGLNIIREKTSQLPEK